MLETPAPQVNFDPDTPQLPLLEVRVKPEPEPRESQHLVLWIWKSGDEYLPLGVAKYVAQEPLLYHVIALMRHPTWLP